jgi:hypothetical protein
MCVGVEDGWPNDRSYVLPTGHGSSHWFGFDPNLFFLLHLRFMHGDIYIFAKNKKRTLHG